MITGAKALTFYLTGRCNTLEEVAEMLGVCQGAVSRRLHRYQKLIGTALFEPGKKPVVLNHTGRYIWNYIDSDREICKGLLSLMIGHEADRNETIIIGCRDYLPVGMISGILGSFAEKHPDIPVELRSMHGEDMCYSLKSELIDIAFTTSSQARSVLAPLSKTFDDRWGLLVQRGSELEEKEYLTAPDILNNNLILPYDLESYSCIKKHMRDNGINPQVIHRYSDFATAITMAGAGIGLTYIPLANSDRIDRERFVLKPFSPSLPLKYLFAGRRDALVRPKLKFFTDHLNDYFRSARES